MRRNVRWGLLVALPAISCSRAPAPVKPSYSTGPVAELDVGTPPGPDEIAVSAVGGQTFNLRLKGPATGAQYRLEYDITGEPFEKRKRVQPAHGEFGAQDLY